MPNAGLIVQAAVLGLGISLITAFLTSIWSSPALPKGIPRVREGLKSRFSLSSRIAYLNDCKRLYREAYETVHLPYCLKTSSFPLTA